MDKPRTNKPRKKGPFYIAGAVVAAAAITLGLSRIKPAPPSVDRATTLIDTVVRGPLVRQVRGPGTLVPEQIRIIPAVTAGRVEEIFERPGVTVKPGTPLLRLSNPDVELQLLESESALSDAKSALVNLRSTLTTERLNQQGQVATIQAQYNQAARQDSVNQELLAKQLIAPNEAAQAKDAIKELAVRLAIEKERLEVLQGSEQAQIDAQQSEVDRLTQIVAFRRQQLQSMNVVAGTEGVLQVLDLDMGQWVNPGIELARVVKPDKLKAELRIPETQAVDIALGQVAHIDTRNGIVDGHVVRIDPAAEGGTVGVDVGLPDDLPPGARPDLSVDGTIEIERLPDVLYMGRPPYGSANSTIGIFKLLPDGDEAVRVTVKLGQASVNDVVVQQGLNEGDIVILSDMSAYDSYDRVRLR